MALVVMVAFRVHHLQGLYVAKTPIRPPFVFCLKKMALRAVIPQSSRKFRKILWILICLAENIFCLICILYRRHLMRLDYTYTSLLQMNSDISRLQTEKLFCYNLI